MTKDTRERSFSHEIFFVLYLNNCFIIRHILLNMSEEVLYLKLKKIQRMKILNIKISEDACKLMLEK